MSAVHRIRVVSAVLFLGAGLLGCLDLTPAICSAGEHYSLGTIQEQEALDVPLGGEVTTSVGLYNIDGTVPVHVDIATADIPDGLEVELQPHCDDAEIVVDAAPHHIDVRIPVMTLYAERPGCESSCCRSWWLQGRGYVCAVAVDVHIRSTGQPLELDSVPVTLSVVASWDQAPHAPPQERELSYEVRLVQAEAAPLSRLPGLAVVVLGTIGLLLLTRYIAKSSVL